MNDYNVMSIKFDEENQECYVEGTFVPNKVVTLDDIRKCLPNVQTFDVVCIGKINNFNVDVWINDMGMYEEDYFFCLKTGVEGDFIQLFGEVIICLSDELGDSIAFENEGQFRDVFEEFILGKLVKSIIRSQKEIIINK